VAAGEPLPLRQDQLRIHGHAIEARICAENPDNGFLPTTGTLRVYRKPDAVAFARGAVRIDDGVREGDAITPFYDSMIAKLIVHGADRREALARLDAALAQVRIVGLPTNVQFLRRVAASPSFAEARLDTALIERERAVLFDQEALGLPLAAAAAVAHQLQSEAALETADPFSRRDGWRSHGAMARRFDFAFRGEPAQALLTRGRDGRRWLAVGAPTAGGDAEPFGCDLRPDGALDLRLGDRRATAHVHENHGEVHVFCRQGATQIIATDPLAHAGDARAEGGRLTAPMPGRIVSFAVRPGDAVTRGQPLAVMEAMKMEHTIAAPADGVVADLLYAPGDQVAEGAELLRLAA
jgi:3-methylcrotonyl-CoA carboxylase alpha subunit